MVYMCKIKYVMQILGLGTYIWIESNQFSFKQGFNVL